MRKSDNKGLTLVELVIAISMATIVIGSAGLFLYNAERSYRVAEYTIDLQMETQILMEQIGNWVMESNWVSVGGSGTDCVLVLYSIPRSKLADDLSEQARVATRKVIFCKNGKLYMISSNDSEEDEENKYIKNIKDESYDVSSLVPSEEPNIGNCIGEYVKTFGVELPSGVDENAITSVAINLGLSEGVTGQSQSYTATNVFSLRNGIYKDDK